MMVFAKTVTVDPNTSKSSLVRTDWRMVNGVISRFELYFPPGPAGLMGVCVFNGSTRLWPYDEQEFFIGDNVTITFDDIVVFDNPVRELQIYAYNLDTVFSHMFQIRTSIVTDPAIIRAMFGEIDISGLAEVAGALQATAALLAVKTKPAVVLPESII